MGKSSIIEDSQAIDDLNGLTRSYSQNKSLIYKICSKQEWQTAIEQGRFTGSPVDIADGFIHFSAAAQVRETAAKHFKGQGDLLLIAVNEDQFGDELKWEVSRGGAKFPHLYGPLAVICASKIHELPIGVDGNHVFPNDLP